ncbi:SLC13 family permease [Vallicoccus soli]|uniref:Dicarboxylate carrier MatC N-terminal domain-containing protein n=1 Tax=Vallicoccus soli TaxID=2339232 RepID=A0A3A3Z1V5_9ACTN|nr:SLC13 family permease [Vallicoccus soli]RJK96714.1 hypothetical protein D5H78_05365 [Vallicoccus soli]
MSPELISILALVAMFVVATFLPINMGLLALVGAFLVGTAVAGFETDDILGGFPGSLFVTLVGITYLFAIAQNNGTIDWLVRTAVRGVRGRVWLIPWVMFSVAALLTAVGAVSPAAVAILAPVALGIAAQYGISPLLMGLLIVHGAQAGGFSPISIYGSTVNDIVDSSGLPGDELVLFLSSLLFNLVVAVGLFLVLGGRRLMALRIDPTTGDAHDGDGNRVSVPGRSVPVRGHGGTEAATAQGGHALALSDGPGLTRDQGLTLVGLLALAVAAFGFDLDVGLVAVTVAVVLALLSPASQKGAVDKVAWSTVLLVGGVVTYVAVLQEMGTIDYVGTTVSDLGAPLLVALLLCFVGGIVSAFASSTAILAATIPLAVPFLLAGEVGAVGLIAALAVSSTMVDVSPFSTNGALVLANAQGVDRDAFYRQLLLYGAAVVVLAPVATWLVLVVPGWL